jgi:hypothetical protein
MGVVVIGHNFESILPKDHPCHVCFRLVDWFQRKRLLKNSEGGVSTGVRQAGKRPLTFSGHSFNIGPYGKKCFKIFSSETSNPI